MVQNHMQEKLILGTMAIALVMGTHALSATPTLGDSAHPLPRPDHVVIVIEEKHSYSQLIDLPDAPYINKLAAQGAVFT